jgi:7-cyano-7-deazaguanine synthase
MSRAIIVFSGGQDSTTVLGMARHMGYECFPIAFDYGQKHKVELEQAKHICSVLGLELKIVNVREFGKLVGSHSALLDSGQDVGDPSKLADHLPASFVPNRNAMFLTMAHGYAQIVGADTVWTGVCQTDYSGYPDCRENFVRALSFALNTGYQTNIQIITPLMNATKAETFKMAEDAGVLDLVLDESHTCYNGVRNSGPHMSKEVKYQFVEPGRHAWGHGCGECPACKIRERGWNEYTNLVRIA